MWLRRLTPAVALTVVACLPPSSDQASSTGSSPGTETVALAVTHRSEWRTLWIEGDTDLPDGAVVSYRVAHALARSTPADQWPAANLIESGRASVQDGRYWTRINTLNWPAGDVRVVIQFPLPPQPPAIEERYGEFGEHLTGDNVIDRDGIKVVEVEHGFEHRP